MFLDVFQRVYDETGVIVTIPAAVYLYSGVVGAIERTFGASQEWQISEIDRRKVEDVLGQEISDLGGSDKVMQQLPSRDLVYLIGYLSDERGIRIDSQGSAFLAQLLGRAVDVVALTGANLVVEQRRPRLLLPGDIIAACKAVFKNKWWFLC